MTRARIFAFAFASVISAGLVACSSSDDASGAETTTTATTTTTGHTTATGSASSAGGASSSADTATSSGVTSAAGGGPTSLFPLAMGDHWTYVVTAVGDGAVCSPGTFDEKVDGKMMMDGRDTFLVSSYCTGITGDTDFSVTSTGEIDFDYQGTWLDYIDPNLVEGHMWSYLNTSFTWHDAGSVTVPAGTFSGCWTANQDVSYTAYSTFCPGEGLVESYSKDLTGAGWDAKLMAYTVN